MAIEVFNRYEHKYLLDRTTYEQVLNIMDEHMELDAYNTNHEPYTISNIYYDTADDILIRRSIKGPVYKEKLRLRSYGTPDEDTKVFLEIKKKFNGLVNKRRVILKLNEAYAFIRKETVPDSEYINRQILNEISYFINCYQLMPKVVISYDRVAYFEKGNPDLRVSFDSNIRSRRYDIGLEYGNYGNLLFDDDLYLMEIKTSMAKPLWICDMLTKLDIKRRSFSKYGMEFVQYINGKGVNNDENINENIRLYA